MIGNERVNVADVHLVLSACFLHNTFNTTLYVGYYLSMCDYFLNFFSTTVSLCTGIL